MAVIEFGEEVRASSLHGFGASGDTDSPHYFDQAQMMVDHEMKPAWLSLEDVKREAVRTYRVSNAE